MKPPADHTFGETVTFEIEIKLLGSDFINIQKINVTDLPLGDISFYPDGTMISGDSRYKVTRVESTYYGYGYGYGYDQKLGYGYDFGYGTGYGYGYGYGHFEDDKVSYLRYNIDVSGLPVDTYISKDVHIDVFVDGNPNKPAFSVDERYNFRIKEKKKPSGISLGASLMQTQTLFNGIATFWGNIARHIASIEIPGATGSVTVKLLNANPTTKDIDGFNYRFININAGPNSNRPGIINFRVRRDSLESAGLDPNDVTIYRFSDGQWTELPSEWVGTDDGYEKYRASTSGFSSFVIAESGAMPIAEETETPSIEAEPGAGGIEEPTPTEKKGIPGFEAPLVVAGLMAIAYLLKRTRG